MKTNKYLKSFLTISLIFIAGIISAQESDLLKKGIEKLDIAYTNFNIPQVMNAHGIFERIYEADAENNYALYYKLLAEYRMITADRSAEFQMLNRYYDKAIESLETLSEDKLLGSEAKVLKAGIHMMKLADSPMSAIFLSPKIHSLLDEALVDNPGNPRAYIVKGIMALNTPAMFGGSAEDAVKYFKNAKQLFETTNNENVLMPSWGYLESFAWTGQAYVKLENYDSAKSIYEKGLAVNPEYGWIKNVLLPRLNGSSQQEEN